MISGTGRWSLAYIGLLGVEIKHMYQNTSGSIRFLLFYVILGYSSRDYYYKRLVKVLSRGQRAHNG